MPILIEDITAFVVALVILMLLGNGVLIATTIVRRQRRDRYFQRIDDLRRRFGPVIANVISRKADYQQGLKLLEGISGLDRNYVLEQLLLSRDATASELPILRQLCEDLGLVKIWQRQLRGRFDVLSLRDTLMRPEGILHRLARLGFLLRARSAENLGTIRHQESWPLLVEALDDSHFDVQIVALRTLAAIGEPKSFAPLSARLNRALLDPASPISLRPIKSALVAFPFSHAIELLPSLRHPDGRVRFMATDIIREMIERRAEGDEDFALSPTQVAHELRETFLTQLCFDDNPDVRARAAPVLAYFEDPRATPVLVTLLEDRQWFVRLHTVRALSKRRYLTQAGEILRRLSDRHWMVREAAARAMLVFGRVGVDQLAEYFLTTPDRYSREQIADEIQRAGLVPNILAQYAETEESRGGQVIGQLARMGKTSYLLELVDASTDRNLRKKFMVNFGRETDSKIRAWVTKVASEATDPELRGLARFAAGVPGPQRSR